MPSNEEILQQQQLLKSHRDRLAVRITQEAMVGAAHAAPDVIQDIVDARTQIQRIKNLLRSWHIVVEDHPNDEGEMLALGSVVPTPPATPQPRPPQLDQDFVERGQSFSQGMSALRDLMVRIPEARDTLIAVRADIQAACDHIEVLDNYKALHDLLHELQKLCFDCIDQEARRFPSDDLAADNLQQYELNFEDIVNRMQEVVAQSTFAGSKTTWIQDLGYAQQELHDAIENLDVKQLQKATRRIKRVLNLQPSLINTHLNDAARALRLPTLMKALTQVRDTLSRPDLDPEKIRQFEAGVAALTSLNHDLATLIDEHDRWQVVDCVLRRIEDRLEQDLDELEWSWPDLKAKGERLYGECAEKWAHGLKADCEKLESALAASDHARVKQFFRRYRSQAGNRFYRIDATLKGLCDELRQVDGPLAFVLRMLE